MRSNFHQTELGLLPRTWEVRPLGEVLTRSRLGGNYQNRAHETSRPLIKMGNLARGHIDLRRVEYVPESDTVDTEHRLRNGDVLFNTRNTIDLVGKVAIWRGELPIAYYNSNIMRLEFDPRSVVSNEYANYALNAQRTVGALRALATGTTSVAAIYTRDLLTLPFIVPPHEEQRAIATALSDVDTLISELYQLIAKKSEIKQGLMQQLLTGKVRLPGFQGDWKVVLFEELATPRKERADPRRSGEEQFCVELEHLESGTGKRIGEVTAGSSASLKTRFQPEDVLFGKLRAYLRKYWLADRPGVCSTEIWALAPIAGGAVPSYLYHLVTMDEFIEVASTAYGTHMPRSDWNLVRRFEVRVPCVNEQSVIAEVLNDMDREITALEARRDKTKLLKQGMMQELLTGRTRLV